MGPVRNVFHGRQKGYDSTRPRMRITASFGLFLACWIPTGPACAEEKTLPLSIEVRARRIAAGEPLRIVVESPEPLASLAGEFLDEPVHMTRVGSDDRGERWSGWSMVPLDEQAGLFAIEMVGVGANGRPAGGSRAVTVEHKEFPEEQLQVEPRFVNPPPEVAERLARERRQLGVIYRSRRPAPSYREAFVRPVPGEPTSVFGMRRLYNGEPRSPHPGLDLRAPTGTSVVASGPGLVVLARDLYYSGGTVILDHGGGLFTLYAHLSEILVEEGQAARGGQRIGRSGATGRVTGPHLHWGAKIGNRPFDPTALLDEALFR
jgi:murein DD-endopeptidase MepM/ murein hydrolase activator NlpD